MIGSENTGSSDYGEGSSPPSAACDKKCRFAIGKYQKLKKERANDLIQASLEADTQIVELNRQLEFKTTEIEALRKKLHNAEEIVRRRKRKIADLEATGDENECPAPQTKMPRPPNVSTKVQKNCSEKAENLSRWQLLRRKKKTLAALKPIHCATSSNTSSSQEKAVQDGLWTTLIGTTPKPAIAEYISTSKVCMNEILPTILKSKVDKYVKSDANNIRSMRVLYEGGLISKRKYTSIRNSSDIVKQSDNGSLRNLKSEIMQGCEIPKIIPYKTLMSHIRYVDIGEVVGLEILAERFSTEAVSGVYRPLKPFLLKLADLYLLLHEKKPCLHWFNEEKSVFYVAVGADGAP